MQPKLYNKLLNNIINKCHVFVLPSIEDGYGLVVLQAAEAGCPIIVSENAGASDFITNNKCGFIVPVKNSNAITDKENGILVPNEDFHKLANAILELITDKPKCERYGSSGYNLVQTECNSKSMVKKTLKLYEQIVNKRIMKK